ncbi:MAG: cobalamin-independent methionine synthase II family protein [Fuerstiella sp.]|jgi:5-methyltetrahydropteroyltriglutamate--homocysteine methyltransferase|nr:cobalamin-independent methionine synthase II family protein [Fuerstiella sp.]MCP4507199.1 cobalamin-independent methionine synthase II family protein [Fuerstiella sp.]MDG2126879.1 cobalamin-independent methionine synthase II family protein [Fuerstiella sp.]
MKRSTEKLLTTHVGSLARPDRQLALLFAKERGEAYEIAEFEASTRQAVDDIVKGQVKAGIDVVCDGEQGKSSFLTYIAERLEGFSPREQQGEDLWVDSRETIAFPEFYDAHRKSREGLIAQPVKLVCTGPVKYCGHQTLQREIENVKAAARNNRVDDVFMTAVSPSDVEGQQPNEFYDSAEDYLHAIADAMHEEYKAIVDSGLILQIDDPRLLTYYISQPDLSVADCRRWAEVRVEALNHALKGLPADRIRFHTCYGINIGPRVHEMNLADIVDIMLKVNAGAYLFEAGNPRHEHEWKIWENVNLPEGKIIVPGVISHSTPLVEHPELVAQRLIRFANIVGKENVIGGSDCGFASFAATEQEIHPRIVWAKFANLAEGARIASKELWS